MNKLGSYLKEQRESKKISLETLYEETKIRQVYLVAIEKGEYETLPGEVYLKGFLRTLARELQLDYAHLLTLYSEDTGVNHYDSSNELKPNNNLKEIQNENNIKRRFFYIMGSLILISVVVIVLMSIYK